MCTGDSIYKTKPITNKHCMHARHTNINNKYTYTPAQPSAAAARSEAAAAATTTKPEQEQQQQQQQKQQQQQQQKRALQQLPQRHRWLFRLQ